MIVQRTSSRLCFTEAVCTVSQGWRQAVARQHTKGMGDGADEDAEPLICSGGWVGMYLMHKCYSQRRLLSAACKSCFMGTFVPLATIGRGAAGTCVGSAGLVERCPAPSSAGNSHLQGCEAQILHQQAVVRDVPQRRIIAQGCGASGRAPAGSVSFVHRLPAQQTSHDCCPRPVHEVSTAIHLCYAARAGH
jgi:hypothetical protein